MSSSDSQEKFDFSFSELLNNNDRFARDLELRKKFAFAFAKRSTGGDDVLIEARSGNPSLAHDAGMRFAFAKRRAPKGNRPCLVQSVPHHNHCRVRSIRARQLRVNQHDDVINESYFQNGRLFEICYDLELVLLCFYLQSSLSLFYDITDLRWRQNKDSMCCLEVSTVRLAKQVHRCTTCRRLSCQCTAHESPASGSLFLLPLTNRCLRIPFPPSNRTSISLSRSARVFDEMQRSPRRIASPVNRTPSFEVLPPISSLVLKLLFR